MPLSKEKRKQIIKMRDAFIKDNKLDPEKTKMGFMDENENIGKIERLPTGIIAFDILTGGGFVKGKINRIYGGESAGKSTMFLKSMGYWQNTIDDYFTAYLPSEKSFDRTWAIANGCEPEQSWIFEAQDAEMNLDFCIKCAEPANGVDCLIIDTLQALSSKKEIYKGKSSKERSVEDDSMALLPRLYSQFLRMYTSKSIDNLTLILASQVRTDLNPMANGAKKATGGNAIEHYNVLSVKMTRLGNSAWPSTDIPPNSYAGKFVIEKSKVGGRYKGNELPFYFYKGSFDHKFNVVALGKDVGIHDGRSIKYPKREIANPNNPEADGSNETMVEFKARGFNDFFNRIPDEAVEYIESQLMNAYSSKILGYIPEEEEELPEGYSGESDV